MPDLKHMLSGHDGASTSRVFVCLCTPLLLAQHLVGVTLNRLAVTYLTYTARQSRSLVSDVGDSLYAPGGGDREKLSRLRS